MFWNKRNVREHEQYRLISSVEKTRKSWSDVQAWRICHQQSFEAQMPKILAEIRYRYLLQQARNRQFVNRWYFEFQETDRQYSSERY